MSLAYYIWMSMTAIGVVVVVRVRGDVVLVLVIVWMRQLTPEPVVEAESSSRVLMKQEVLKENPRWSWRAANVFVGFFCRC